MTEAEWQTCTDPTPMLEALRASGKATDRKLRLFAVAGCRHRFGNYFAAGDPGQKAIEVAERYGDGLATREEVEAAQRSAAEYGEQFLDAVFGYTDACAAYLAAAALLDKSTSGMAGHTCFPSDPAEMRTAHAALLRDLFGPLVFHPVTIPPSVRTWNNGTVLRLATASYEHRSLPSGHLDPVRLAILADALEDAGATDAELLAHLRSQGPHVRGCVAVDLVLN
jgi:hypothetical protein